MTGVPFNGVYHYMEWLLTVSLLLIEILLVTKLDDAESNSKAWNLGLGSALLIVLAWPQVSREACCRSSRGSSAALRGLLPKLCVAPLQLCEARSAWWRGSSRLLSPARPAAAAPRCSLVALRGLAVGAAPRQPCEVCCRSSTTLVAGCLSSWEVCGRSSAKLLSSCARPSARARLLGSSARLGGRSSATPLGSSAKLSLNSTLRPWSP